MNPLICAGLEALCVSVLLLPAMYLRNRSLFQSRRRSILAALLCIYLAAMYVLVGLPNIMYIRFEPNINLKPFAYMFSDWDASALNVLLFIPLGCMLPLLWEYFRHWYRTVPFGFLCSLSIELLQIFTFRATDINDLMTNTLGTVLGYLLAKPLLRFFPISEAEDRKEISAFFLISFCVLFIAQPFASRLVWIIF